MREHAIGFIVGVIVSAIMVGGVQLYHRMSPRPSMPAPVASELRKEATESVAVTSVQAFAPATKQKLWLPPAVQASTDAHVVAATQVPSTLRPQTVTAVLDTHTGATSLYIRNDPLPWIALEQHGELSLSRGFRSDIQIYRATFREDVLQIKAAHLGVVGSVDSDGQWFAGVGIRIGW